MWSLIQHRRLQRQAVAQFSKGQLQPEKHGGSASPGVQSPADDAESTQHLPPYLQPSHDDDGKIYVKTTGDDDPLDPRNWPLLHRSKNIAVLSYLVFVQAWAGAAESMANSTTSSEQGHSKVAENLTITMYLVGIGVGSLFAGPVSESVGRNPTYLVSSFCYLCFVLGAALSPNFGGRMVCRFLMGLFASPTLSVNGSSVKDQFRPVKRAFVFPIIAWANVACKCAQIHRDFLGRG
jgi:predicted MFS family arabinose efflux permease